MLQQSTCLVDPFLLRFVFPVILSILVKCLCTAPAPTIPTWRHCCTKLVLEKDSIFLNPLQTAFVPKLHRFKVFQLPVRLVASAVALLAKLRNVPSSLLCREATSINLTALISSIFLTH